MATARSRLRSGTPIGRRVRARMLLATSWLACRLPEAPLLALADFVGDVSYRLATERRRRARRNLLRIARWLAARGTGSQAARAAASDPRALTRDHGRRAERPPRPWLPGSSSLKLFVGSWVGTRANQCSVKPATRLMSRLSGGPPIWPPPR